jgi:hypothetical protein
MFPDNKIHFWLGVFVAEEVATLPDSCNAFSRTLDMADGNWLRKEFAQLKEETALTVKLSVK